MNLIINPPIIAHRGACLAAPENTFAAFRKAKELGLNWVEFDVMLTSDEEAVVIHDETLDRTSCGKGRVADLAYSEMKMLDAGSWFGENYKDERIPLLRDVLKLLISLEMNANIEIKAQNGWENKTVLKVLDIVDQFWLKDYTPLLFTSFSTKVLQNIKEQSGQYLIGFIMDKWLQNWFKYCDDLNATTLVVNHVLLTQQRAAEIKETSRTLLAYTVNEPSRAYELYAWGVDAVFSDCPETMLKTI